ncbi:MAG: PDZ domain-containing protein [Candidatus Eisenbacteria bacterium]|uniref:PDZ domain-containing protein n=1 Tax=Eiseniibacteriota bacterium TaxID=2212470 RepID=A0A9D6L4Q1_UNCEI|nr:PDZ domain-containing protein [Candidatus Eisenbacteria bacterium]
MRKRWIMRAALGTALMLAATGAMTGRAAAQSNDTAWLGVTTQEITRDLRDGLDFRGSGALVNRVVEDGPADRAGVRNGDVIVSFNSRAVASPEDLTRMVRGCRVGQSVSITVMRDSQRRTLTAHLGTRPEDGEEGGDRESVETPVAPEPPETPEPPAARAPRTAPRARVFTWNGDGFDMQNGDGMAMLRTMGRGRLGVQVQNRSEGLAEALGVTGGRGVLVTDVVKDTPAERAGMRAGDVIVRVGDRSVESVEELQRALDREGRVSVVVARRGARRTLEADLGARSSRESIVLPRGQALRIPDIRSRVLRDLGRDRSDSELNGKDRDAMEQELRALRDEVRELRRKLEDQDRNH